MSFVKHINHFEVKRNELKFESLFGCRAQNIPQHTCIETPGLYSALILCSTEWKITFEN